LFHSVVEAVRGIEYPAERPGLKVNVPLDEAIERVIPFDDVVAKVNEVVATPLIEVVAKYPLSVLPAHDRYVPACIRDEGAL
jgi:hypothetical protein